VAFNQQINAIIPKADINIVFLYHLTKSISSYIRDNATTGMKHIITKSVMESLIIPIPPLDLQKQFASKIEAIEHQKELIKQSIKEVETLFNSRMDYYFN
jgi:type I restriction enzyme S subunit